MTVHFYRKHRRATNFKCEMKLENKTKVMNITINYEKVSDVEGWNFDIDRRERKERRHPILAYNSKYRQKGEH